MIKNEGGLRLGANILVLTFLCAILSACSLNRWLPVESGNYKSVANGGATGPIEFIEVDRDNQLAFFTLTNGSQIVVSFSYRAKSDWPTGCPANIGSTYMEVLDIADKPLAIAELTFEDPILIRDCPKDPERIALRDDGFTGSGGSACAGLEQCLSFGRQSSTTPIQTKPNLSTEPLPHSMKGYELYSWYDEEDASWRYTLITGTNRLKTFEEITTAENQITQSEWVKVTVTGTEELKALLRRLPPGTELTWRGGDWLESEGQASATPNLVAESTARPPDEPTVVTGADVTPTAEETTVDNTPEIKYEVLSDVLPIFLMSGNYQTLEPLMGDPFTIGYWRSEGQSLEPAEAVKQLRYLLPEPESFRFTTDRSLFPDLGDFDPVQAFGPKVKIVDLVYCEGWGADGQGAAILTIGLNLDGQYWPGMIYAPAGFEDDTGANSESQGETQTYTNEHAGYAFDYPAGWIVKGEPRPKSTIYAITLQSFKLAGGPGPVPSDEAKLDFVTCNSADCNTLQALQAQIDEQVAAGELEILSEENWTLAEGIPAIRRQVIGEMGAEVASLITEFDGQVLRVSGYGDIAAFDDIVRTLRPAQSQPSATGLRAVLEIPSSLPAGEAVKLRFTLMNDSDSRLYVLNWFTPLEGIGGEIFRVKRDGMILPYQGILASRGDPTPDAYTLIEAGGSASAEVDLSAAYDFSIPGTYTIEFVSPRISHVARTEEEMARSLDDLAPVQIPSNQVTLQIGAGGVSQTRSNPAQETLVRYFSLLSEGMYASAVKLYGAGYGMLKEWNPDVDPDDLAKLLEQGCLVNGLHCLPVKTVESKGTIGPNTHEFAVQFENPDGSLFVLNPEGEWVEDDHPRSSFLYTVARTFNGFVVQELPVYGP